MPYQHHQIIHPHLNQVAAQLTHHHVNHGINPNPLPPGVEHRFRRMAEGFYMDPLPPKSQAGRSNSPSPTRKQSESTHRPRSSKCTSHETIHSTRTQSSTGTYKSKHSNCSSHRSRSSSNNKSVHSSIPRLRSRSSTQNSRTAASADELETKLRDLKVRDHLEELNIMADLKMQGDMGMLEVENKQDRSISQILHTHTGKNNGKNHVLDECLDGNASDGIGNAEIEIEIEDDDDYYHHEYDHTTEKPKISDKNNNSNVQLRNNNNSNQNSPRNSQNLEKRVSQNCSTQTHIIDRNLQEVLQQELDLGEEKLDNGEEKLCDSQVSSTDYNDLVNEWDSISAHLERRQQASEIRKSVAQLRQKIDGLDAQAEELQGVMHDDTLDAIYNKNVEDESSNGSSVAKIDKMDKNDRQIDSRTLDSKTTQDSKNSESKSQNSKNSGNFEKLIEKGDKNKPTGIKRSKSIYDRFAGALTFSNSTKRTNKPLIKRKQSKEKQLEPEQIQYRMELHQDILARTKTENSEDLKNEKDDKFNDKYLLRSKTFDYSKPDKAMSPQEALMKSINKNKAANRLSQNPAAMTRVIRIFRGAGLNETANYKSILASSISTGREIIELALARYNTSSQKWRAFDLFETIGYLTPSDDSSPEDVFHEEYRRLISISDQPLMTTKINTRNLVIRLELCQKFDANARQILNTTESVLNMRCSKVVSKSQIEKFQKMNQESLKTDSSVGSSSMKIGDSGNGSDMTEAKIQQRKRTQSGSEMLISVTTMSTQTETGSKITQRSESNSTADSILQQSDQTTHEFTQNITPDNQAYLLLLSKPSDTKKSVVPSLVQVLKSDTNIIGRKNQTRRNAGVPNVEILNCGFIKFEHCTITKRFDDMQKRTRYWLKTENTQAFVMHNRKLLPHYVETEIQTGDLLALSRDRNGESLDSQKVEFMFVDPHQQFGTPKFMRNSSNSNDTNGLSRTTSGNPNPSLEKIPPMNISELMSEIGSKHELMEMNEELNRMTAEISGHAKNINDLKNYELKNQDSRNQESRNQDSRNQDSRNQDSTNNEKSKQNNTNNDLAGVTQLEKDIIEMNDGIDQMHETGVSPNRKSVHRMSSMDSHRSMPESIENSECAPPTSQFQAELKCNKNKIKQKKKDKRYKDVENNRPNSTIRLIRAKPRGRVSLVERVTFRLPLHYSQINERTMVDQTMNLMDETNKFSFATQLETNMSGTAGTCPTSLTTRTFSTSSTGFSQNHDHEEIITVLCTIIVHSKYMTFKTDVLDTLSKRLSARVNTLCYQRRSVDVNQVYVTSVNEYFEWLNSYLITMSTITQLIGYISTDALPLSLNKLILPENLHTDDRSAIFKKNTANIPLNTFKEHPSILLLEQSATALVKHVTEQFCASLKLALYHLVDNAETSNFLVEMTELLVIQLQSLKLSEKIRCEILAVVSVFISTEILVICLNGSLLIKNSGKMGETLSSKLRTIQLALASDKNAVNCPDQYFDSSCMKLLNLSSEELATSNLSGLKEKFPKLKMAEINAILSRCVMTGRITRNSRLYDTMDIEALILMRRDTVRRLTREMSITRAITDFKIDLQELTTSSSFMRLIKKIQGQLPNSDDIVIMPLGPPVKENTSSNFVEDNTQRVERRENFAHLRAQFEQSDTEGTTSSSGNANLNENANNNPNLLNKRLKQTEDTSEGYQTYDGQTSNVSAKSGRSARSNRSEQSESSTGLDSQNFIGHEQQILTINPHTQLIVINMVEHGNCAVATSEQGLGIGLISGLRTNIGRPGLFIKEIRPASPATMYSLSIGDQLLAVNGQSVIGMSHRYAVELIKKYTLGGSVRLVVDKNVIYHSLMQGNGQVTELEKPGSLRREGSMVKR